MNAEPTVGTTGLLPHLVPTTIGAVVDLVSWSTRHGIPSYKIPYSDKLLESMCANVRRYPDDSIIMLGSAALLEHLGFNLRSSRPAVFVVGAFQVTAFTLPEGNRMYVASLDPNGDLMFAVGCDLLPDFT